jgi:hypothetical protein
MTPRASTPSKRCRARQWRAAAASANSLAIVRLFSEPFCLPPVLRPAAIYFLYLIFVYFHKPLRSRAERQGTSPAPQGLTKIKPSKEVRDGKRSAKTSSEARHPQGAGGTRQTAMIRKLKSGGYRLYSRKVNPKTGRRRNLGTFKTRAAAANHERAVQYFKRH